MSLAVSQQRRRPITVALVDDYDVVVMGVANMFDNYRDRVVVAELDATMGVRRRGRRRPLRLVRATGVRPPRDRRAGREPARPPSRGVHVELSPDLIESARQHGAHGYLSKTLPARDLVAALEAVHAGEMVISDAPARTRSAVGLDWPGRGEGFSDRESEILALITQGKSNAEVAALTYLSPNTVKSYIRTIYRKIDAGSRTQAVLWGVDHGFTPDHHRIEHWKGGP